MNKERLIDLAEWCEAGCPERAEVVGFDMSIGIIPSDDYCGTVCCLAGAATQFFGGDDGRSLAQKSKDDFLGANWRDADRDGLCVRRVAMDVLDIDEHVAYELFEPTGSRNITPAMAARTLRHLVETGEVRWERLA